MIPDYRYGSRIMCKFVRLAWLRRLHASGHPINNMLWDNGFAISILFKNSWPIPVQRMHCHRRTIVDAQIDGVAA